MVENNLFPLLKKTARSFYLTICLLPKPLREPVALAYLLARASDTIADEGEASCEEREEILNALQKNKISLSLLYDYCKKNFQVFATEKERTNKELIEALPDLLRELEKSERLSEEADAIKAVWHNLIEGQLFDLKMQGSLFTASQRKHYLYLIAGCVGEFWTTLGKLHLANFSQESSEQMKIWGVSYGKGLQLVNILRDAPVDRIKERFYFQASEFSLLMNQAQAYLQEGKKYLKALQDRRFCYASRLPLLLGEQTLALVAKFPNTSNLKVSRYRVLVALVKGFFF